MRSPAPGGLTAAGGAAWAADGNVLMISADRWVVAGEKGPFHAMLEAFSRHWARVDVIGRRPARVVATEIFGNVHLHHPVTGRWRQAAFIERTGRRLAAERDYEVMTSHDYCPFVNGRGAWRIARETGIPWISEIHHVPGHPRAATARERVDRAATRIWCRWAGRRATGFRVVNAGELVPLLTGWGVPGERVHVLPSLYLDLDTFRPAGPPEFDCDVLCVGRLVPSKGVTQVLEAVRRLVAERGLPNLRLRVVGRGPLQGHLRDFVRSRGLSGNVEHVEWVAEPADLARVYRSARVLVSASYSEGGPRVVAEAMACGTPVISTRVGIVPEIVKHGRNGLLFDGTAGELTLRLQRLLTDSAQEAKLRGNLPPDLSAMRRDTVIANLADGLKAAAAAARR